MQEIKISENVYKEIEKWILRLKQCKVNDDILSIPGEILYEWKKYEIKEIGKFAFSDCKQLKFVKIPSSMKVLETIV